MRKANSGGTHELCSYIPTKWNLPYDTVDLIYNISICKHLYFLVKHVSEIMMYNMFHTHLVTFCTKGIGIILILTSRGTLKIKYIKQSKKYDSWFA